MILCISPHLLDSYSITEYISPTGSASEDQDSKTGVGNHFHIKGHFRCYIVLRGPYYYEHITRDLKKRRKKSITAVLLSLMIAAFLDSPNAMAGTVFL